MDDFSEQVQEVLAHYHHSFEPGHPFASLEITEGIAGVPEVWILGSSGTSAGLAGDLGLGYAFAGFINPTFVEAGMAAHRDSFRPPGFRPGEYAGMLALNIVAADDEDTAHRLTWPARAMYRRLAADTARSSRRGPRRRPNFPRR